MFDAEKNSVLSVLHILASVFNFFWDGTVSSPLSLLVSKGIETAKV